jgi:hypothetical protein
MISRSARFKRRSTARDLAKGLTALESLDGVEIETLDSR